MTPLRLPKDRFPFASYPELKGEVKEISGGFSPSGLIPRNKWTPSIEYDYAKGRANLLLRGVNSTTVPVAFSRLKLTLSQVKSLEGYRLFYEDMWENKAVRDKELDKRRKKKEEKERKKQEAEDKKRKVEAAEQKVEEEKEKRMKEDTDRKIQEKRERQVKEEKERKKEKRKQEHDTQKQQKAREENEGEEQENKNEPNQRSILLGEKGRPENGTILNGNTTNAN